MEGEPGAKRQDTDNPDPRKLELMLSLWIEECF